MFIVTTNLAKGNSPNSNPVLIPDGNVMYWHAKCGCCAMFCSLVATSMLPKVYMYAEGLEPVTHSFQLRLNTIRSTIHSSGH